LACFRSKDVTILLSRGHVSTCWCQQR